MIVTPLNQHLIIKPEEFSEQKGNFKTPAQANHDCKVATVVSVSEDCPKDVKEGDRIIYMKVGGHSFDGNIILNYIDLLGVIND